MTFPYSNIEQLLPFIEINSIFLEIGSERGSGSTMFLADLAARHNVTLHSVDICNQPNLSHPSLVLHTAVGSTWCQQVLPTINQKISLLYLDNFDIVWDSLMLAGTYESGEWNRQIYNDLKGQHWPLDYTPYHLLTKEIQQEVWDLFNKKGLPLEQFDFYNNLSQKYKTEFGVDLNNNNCQQEHFAQLMNIIPYLADECIVLFDDTFTINDFWVGKCGPCVVYLQCLGFTIKQIYPNGIALTR